MGKAGKLTHIGAGGEARMVDVSAKPATERVAVAEGRVAMTKETLALVLSGNAKKGDVLGAARIAGIMAAKKTHELIPLCHPLPVSKVEIDIAPAQNPPGLASLTSPTAVKSRPPSISRDTRPDGEPTRRRLPRPHRGPSGRDPCSGKQRSTCRAHAHRWSTCGRSGRRPSGTR